MDIIFVVQICKVFSNMKKKKEILEEIENLKLLLEFHSTYGIIENSKEYEDHINNILKIA